MAKRKGASAPEPPAVPQVGDKVYPPNSPIAYEISHVRVGAIELTLNTNLQRFCVRTDRLASAESKPPAQPSKPFTSPEPVFDGGESLKRQRAPKAIEAVEGLAVD